MKSIRKSLNHFNKTALVAIATGVLLLSATFETNSEPHSLRQFYLNDKLLTGADTQGNQLVVAPPISNFPLNSAFNVETLTPEQYKEGILWAYSNEKASVHTGLDGREFRATSSPQFSDYPSDHDHFDQIKTHMQWVGGFSKNPGSEKIGFTLLPGFLLHQIADSGEGYEDYPATSSEFEVQISYFQPFDSSGGRLLECGDDDCASYVLQIIDQFSTKANILGYVDKKSTRFNKQTCESFLCTENSTDDPVWGNSPEWVGDKGYKATPGTGLRWDSNRYKGVLDPSGLRDGEYASIIYDLTLTGLASNDGRGSHAKLADPLDPFDPQNPGTPELETGGLISSNDFDNVNVCNELPPVDRYQIDTDGTVTDNHTGLMWQRCPQNYTLSDGVAGNLVDDQCIADVVGIESADWSQSLQSASGNTQAGHSDWRLPTAKELESIVEGCVPSTINHIAFPSAPTTLADNYWSSTPATGDNAWVVNFQNGDIQPLTTTSLAHSRLVRNSSSPILRAKPSLRAGFGRLIEGDSGTGSLSLPIMLSRAADSAVTVDYVISAGSAIDGVDFIASSGTATIAAGDTGTTVDVVINGDLEAERHEYFRLTLSNPSSNVAMARPIGLGRIIDDDRVSLGAPRIALQLEEGDSGSPETLEIPVILSHPLKSGSVSVDYSLRSDTAIAGTDFVVSSGTLNFNVGEQEKFITVESIGNNSWQNDHNFYVDLSNAFGAKFTDGFDSAEVYVRLVDDDGVAHGTSLNDTGPPECGTDCPVLAGQDKDTGRDTTANDDTDGIDGFAFSKLDSSGVPLANQQAGYGNPAWDCVEDQVTGLFWEVKTPTFSGVPDIRKGGETFSWYNSSGVNTNGVLGTENGGICNGNTDCDTEKYIAHINAIDLCGFSDWRLPNVDELSNVMYDGGPFFGPTLDTDYFPNQVIGESNFVRGTWTASPVITDDDFVYFHNSQGMRQQPLSTSSPRFYVRLVRGNQQR